MRLTAKKRSRFDEEMTLEKVVVNMVNHIIDNEVLKPPYISAVTVYQIMYGAGVHWKGQEMLLSAGLLDHAGISRPPNWYLAEQGKRFGYIMDWPPQAIRSVITGSIKGNIVNPLLDGSTDPDYIVGYCQGYINEENGLAKYVPEYGRAISTYFIMNTDESRLNDILTYILSQPLWFKKQWLMTLEKLPEMIVGRKRMADRVHARASAWQKQWKVSEGNGHSLYLDKLNPQVPDDVIDWRDVEPDDD